MEIKIKRLSIIIPVYNEEKTLQTIINKIINLKLINNIKKEIIIIDDGSFDNSKNIIKRISNNKKDIITIFLEENNWKWFAIRAWLEKANWEFVIIQDADLEYNPSDINLLLKKAISDDLNVVYWSRNLRKNSYSSIFFYFWWVFITFLTNIIYKQNLTDEATWYKLIKTNLLKSLKLSANWFDFCIETTAKLSNLWYKIKEVPISYKARSFKEWKKITILDGIITILKIFKYKK